MAHVFISYAHVDGDFVNLVKNEIEKLGFETWTDTERLMAGEDWRNEIDKAIRESFALVAVMSPDAFESKYVTYEWAYALGIGVKVIPLMLRPTKLHPRLEALQYFNFTNREARPWDKFTNRLKQLHTIFHKPLPGIQNQPTLTTLSSSPDNLSNQEISRVLEDLQQSDENKRVLAIKQLVTLSKVANQDIMPYLLIALHDDSIKIRYAAAEALGLMGDARGIPGLKQLLSDTAYVQSKTGKQFLNTQEQIQILRKQYREGQITRSELESKLRELIILDDKGFWWMIGIETDTWYRFDPTNNNWYPDTPKLSDFQPISNPAAQALTRIGTPEALAAVEQWKHEQENKN